MSASFRPCGRGTPGAVSRFLWSAALWLGATVGVWAFQGPVPPCQGPTVPRFAEIDTPLNVRMWFQSELPEDWAPPPCIGWQPRPFTVLVGAAGRFENRRGADAILQRMASISDLTTIQYWSVTRGRWHSLFSDAAALTRPDREARRPDFTTDDLRPGAPLYFWQEESSGAGSAVYRLRVRERGPDRVVFAIDNVSAVTLAFLTLAEPGAYEFLYVLERESPDVWRYYSLSRTGDGPVPFAQSHEESYANRAVALFRYLAGIATDRARRAGSTNAQRADRGGGPPHAPGRPGDGRPGEDREGVGTSPDLLRGHGGADGGGSGTSCRLVQPSA